MAAARERADVLAEAAGLRITGVRAVEEGSDRIPPGPRPLMAKAMFAESDAGTPVEAGSLEVAVTVSVTYRVA